MLKPPPLIAPIGAILLAFSAGYAGDVLPFLAHRQSCRQALTSSEPSPITRFQSPNLSQTSDYQITRERRLWALYNELKKIETPRELREMDHLDDVHELQSSQQKNKWALQAQHTGNRRDALLLEILLLDPDAPLENEEFYSPYLTSKFTDQQTMLVTSLSEKTVGQWTPSRRMGLIEDHEVQARMAYVKDLYRVFVNVLGYWATYLEESSGPETERVMSLQILEKQRYAILKEVQATRKAFNFIEKTMKRKSDNDKLGLMESRLANKILIYQTAKEKYVFNREQLEIKQRALNAKIEDQAITSAVERTKTEIEARRAELQHAQEVQARRENLRLVEDSPAEE